MKKKLLKTMTIVMVMTQLFTIKAYAQTNSYNGYGAGLGRTDTVNINDYSTNSWDRLEYNYQFESGVDYSKELGKPSTTDKMPVNNDNLNIRRNKDVADFPPSYGVFSGVIPTSQTNPYIQKDSMAMVTENTAVIVGNLMPTGDSIGSSNSSNFSMNQSQEFTTGNTSLVSVSTTESNFNTNTNTNLSTSERAIETQAIQYSDGSIGKLSIPKLGVNAKVFEGETQDNMKLGIGHFSYTSAWDGNIGLAGHNRGSADYFKNIKTLNSGDIIEYESMYGVRKYAVEYIEKIPDTDYSHLGYTTDNRITLLTCVENSPNERFAVCAIEIN